MEGPRDSENRFALGENHQEATLITDTNNDGEESNEGNKEDQGEGGELQNDHELGGKKFLVDHCKRGSTKCKVCKKSISKGDLRIGMLVAFKTTYIHQYHHIECAFKRFQRARVSTNAITTSC